MAKECICATDLRTLVSVERLVITDDASQIDLTDDGTWVLVAKEWCKFKSQGSVEITVGDRIQARSLSEVTMRYSGQSIQYTAKMRLRIGERIFNLAGPPQNLNEDNKWLRFQVFEVPSVSN